MTRRWAARRRETGIPVGVGVGPTKTLAKLANQLAKITGTGVVSLDTGPAGDALLPTLPVGEIWGIGWRMEPKLRAEGFRTARGVVGERMWLELNGLSCLPLDALPQPKQSIASTRSFGHPVVTLVALQEALATYASRAAEKLRREQQLAGAGHPQPLLWPRYGTTGLQRSPARLADAAGQTLAPLYHGLGRDCAGGGRAQGIGITAL